MTNNLKYRRRRRRNFWRILGIIVLVLIVLGGATAVYEWHQSSNFIMPSNNSNGGGNGRNKVAANPNILPVLITGIDQRGNENSRTDTMFVAFIDLKSHSVQLLSIPRDTRTTIPGRSGIHKINAANAYGGPELAVKTVNQLLGTDIHYYMQTNFVGFKEIVDALGGVTINIGEKITASGVTFYPGVQRLNGTQALAYVRCRNYPHADIDRIKHQQQFINAVAKETLQAQNVTKIPALLKAFNSTVKTNFSNMQMVQMANNFKSMQSNIEYYTLPGHGQYIGGVSYWIADTSQVKQMVGALNQGKTPQEK